ncbi:hypothetical protein MKZ38_010694 [Zalerion maritima]|uniref:Ankyrin repeat protein n=1 Tax=Zalerion maritima TaxID=339359 RepID=A0AAD5RTD1_9PEZI|nr:hypothetical protein MKZ38_010694 [Zalerion maritima]
MADIVGIVDFAYGVVKDLTAIAMAVKDAPKSLAEVIDQTDKLRLQATRLQAIQQGLPKGNQEQLSMQIRTDSLDEAMKQLGDLTLKIRPGGGAGEKMKVTEKFKWWWKQSDVDGLALRLREETDRLWKIVTTEQLAAQFSQASGNSEQLSQIASISEQLPRLLEALSLRATPGTTDADGPIFDHDGVFSPYKAEAMAWYGQFRCKPGQDLSMPYYRDRYALSSAAYVGDWPSVFKLLDHAEHAYMQKWINCTSISAATEVSSITSGFTPLHQAAWHGKKQAVEVLLGRGAWRLARTARDTRSAAEGSTPLEVAHSHGWDHIYNSLSPQLRRPVRHAVLNILQWRLDGLIKETFEEESEAHLECFLLPQLEIMTEHERSRLWFPLNPELRDTRKGLAVHILLEHNEVTTIMRWGRSKKKVFRITTEGVQEIEQAVILR